MIRRNLSISVLAVCLIAGCASQPESVTVEKKGSLTIVHHRSRRGNGAVDQIEAINAKGVVTTAEIHVYDLGRMPDGNGGMNEAHRYFLGGQWAHWKTNLPPATSPKATGPKTEFTPPKIFPHPQ